MLRRNFLKFATCGAVLSFFGLPQAKADLKKGDIVRFKCDGPYKNKTGKIAFLGTRNSSKELFAFVEFKDHNGENWMILAAIKNLAKL